MSQPHSYNLRKRPCPVIEEKTVKAPKVAKVVKESSKVAKSSKPPKEEKKAKEDVKATKVKKQPIVESKEDVKATKVKKQPIVEPKEVVKAAKVTKVTKTEELNNFIFGQDSCGELGFGKIGFVKKLPVAIPLSRVRQIACGPMHVITLLENGEIYTNGCNDEGALGRVTDGDELLEATPTLVPVPNKVVKVTAGDSHSAVLTDKDEVFIMGNFRDEGGPIGLTPESKGESSYEPIQLLPNIKLKDIASGSNHMLILDHKGVVYSFGAGEQGQLGRIDTDDLTRVTDENRDILLTPMKVDLSSVDPNREFICDRIFAGNFSSFATNTDKKKNRLAAWGLNNYHQLAFKGQKDQLVQNYPKRSTFTCSTTMINVACGQHHTLFLTKNGRLYAAGRNQYGMLGIGSVVGETSLAKPVKSLESVVDIAASINTSFAVNTEGELFSWGMGGIQLGHGDEKDVTDPTKVESLLEKKVKTVSSGTTFTAVVIELNDPNLTYVKPKEV